MFRRYFQFHCTSSGRRLGGYLCTSWCTCLDYDSGARYVFIGDYSGNITVCKLDDGGPAGGAGPGVQYVNTLKGHTGSIQEREFCFHRWKRTFTSYFLAFLICRASNMPQNYHMVPPAVSVNFSSDIFLETCIFINGTS